MSDMSTCILDTFILTANDPRTSGRSPFSNVMAHDLEETLGTRPKVAFVGENHPYVFALMLAVWKIGGIFVPIDAHVPPTLLDGMLEIVKPACLYLSAVDVSNVSPASVLPVEVRVFHPENSTVPALNKRYGSGSNALDSTLSADEPCLYLFTSSASSKQNLKPVSLTPKFILTNCQSKLVWWRRMQPTANLDGTRVLGWAPLSHILSYMQDIGTATFLTAGCVQIYDKLLLLDYLSVAHWTCPGLLQLKGWSLGRTL
ncbi:AMP-binding enzyme-domain-containing protein [Roridomyces roridus]|uniref:AMP-binding enzyme-domain-containing protein n=1 Tax=Roridomyces roridus TaxID=1738132 RepID=A0AAD7CCA6_9AGAR|nr:AMP-binding enzyme-domain-containing protein [Roridomyces roridus]